MVKIIRGNQDYKTRNLSPIFLTIYAEVLRSQLCSIRSFRGHFLSSCDFNVYVLGPETRATQNYPL